MPIKTVREMLYEGGEGPITVRALSDRLGVPIDQIDLLIDYKYLKIVLKKPELAETVVSCPNQRGQEWLRNMSQPIHLKPFIPLEDVHILIRNYQGRLVRDGKGQIRKNAIHKVRQVCLAYGIPIHLDPVYGELLTIEGLWKLNFHMMIYRCTVRKDRATVLAFLLNGIPPEDQEKNGYPLQMPRYTKRLSMEIHRIAQLPEPDRTIQAVALYETWCDARTVQECIRKFRYRPDLTDREKTVMSDVRHMDQEMDQFRKKYID